MCACPSANAGTHSQRRWRWRESRRTASLKTRGCGVWIPACAGMTRGETSANRHLAANFGAQLVDQLEALPGLDMPEGPAVAGLRTLRHSADAVDRADLVAKHDGAVGAHKGAMALLCIDEFRARRDHAALDEFGERNARRL